MASGNSVHIFFSMGNLRRNGVRATIREDDAAVRIALYEGTLPGAPSECAALGENTSLLLTTRSLAGNCRALQQPVCAALVVNDAFLAQLRELVRQRAAVDAEVACQLGLAVGDGEGAGAGLLLLLR